MCRKDGVEIFVERYGIICQKRAVIEVSHECSNGDLHTAEYFVGL